MELLKKGSRGDKVKEIQMALGLNADGIFGQKTEDAVKEFQKNNKLSADGIVGNKTWNKLFSSEMKKLK